MPPRTYESVRRQHEDEIWFRMVALKALKSARAWIVWLGVYAIIQAAGGLVLLLALLVS